MSYNQDRDNDYSSGRSRDNDDDNSYGGGNRSGGYGGGNYGGNYDAEPSQQIMVRNVSGFLLSLKNVFTQSSFSFPTQRLMKISWSCLRLLGRLNLPRFYSMVLARKARELSNFLRFLKRRLLSVRS